MIPTRSPQVSRQRTEADTEVISLILTRRRVGINRQGDRVSASFSTESQPTILIAEDNPGHAALIKRNLKRSGIRNPIRHFKDGQAIVDYLFNQPDLDADSASYVILLDIQMPKLNGIEVLERIKTNPKLKALPVTMLTTTDNPKEVQRCHELGCNNYVMKPVAYDAFMEAIQRLGSFLQIVQVPTMTPSPMLSSRTA